MYVELQCKTNFSFLKGASEASELIQRASQVGLPALAITDVNGVYALPRAFEALKDFPSFKLISGCELTLKDHPPLTLLATTRAAYGVICQILTAAHHGKEKGLASLTFPELIELMKLPGASEVLALSFGSEETRFDLLKAVFGNNLYLFLAHYLDGLDSERTQMALQLSKKWGLRVVATNDVYYHEPERRPLQDVLTCIREGVTLQTAGFRLFPNEERYIKTPQQMVELFKDLPDAIQATLDIAEKCTFYLGELTYQYPSEWIPAGFTAQQYLEKLVLNGAQKIYKGCIPAESLQQIQHEFTLIERMGYADYFLTVYEIVSFAKEQNIYCQGRGSAANSIICYCLGVTIIDPVKMNLLFERFISEDRGEPPDIDVDFEHERREEVIQHIYKKYGRDRAAMISAVRTYRRRSSFLEVSKAVGVPVGTISADELEADFEKYAGPLVEKREVIDQLHSELKGFPRHLSIHSCGFTLSGRPIIETVPIEPARMENRTICQWDKNDLDTMKLIKVDVLSLGFLTVIHKACDMIGIKFNEIPQDDDTAVFAMMQRGDTIGTFQIESRAQISTLGVTRPENFYDLVVEVALVRPGPNVGNMKSPYIVRRDNARKGIPYVFDDPVMEKILGKTYGVPIFQEQVMKLAIEKAGFSPSEADQLRRAIAAWRAADSIDELSDRFFNGLIQGGMPVERAKEFFGYMKGFSAYGFPESHAASFAILSYISAWLKYYYPAELLCGLINSQPMGFYPIDVLINDAKRHGVQVLPVHPNLSEWDAIRLAPRQVRMGFRNIQGVREEEFRQLKAARQQGEFINMGDFLSRTSFQKNVIEAMAMADVFVCFGADQRHSFWNSLELRSILDHKESAQLHFLEKLCPSEPTAQDRSHPIFKPLTLYEGIIEDYRGLGYSLRGNAMTGLRADKSLDLPQGRSRDLKKLPHGSWISYAGIVIVLQRPPTAKGVAFITLEDELGSMDLVLFKGVYEEYAPIIKKTRFLVITGKLDRRGNSLSVLVKTVRSFGSESTQDSKKPIYPGGHPRQIPTIY